MQEEIKKEKMIDSKLIDDIISQLVTRKMEEEKQKIYEKALVKANTDRMMDLHEKNEIACREHRPAAKPQGYYNNIEANRCKSLEYYYRKHAQSGSVNAEIESERTKVESARERYYRSKGEEAYKRYIMKRDQPAEYEAMIKREKEETHYQKLYKLAAAKGDDYLQKWLLKRNDPVAYNKIVTEQRRLLYAQQRYAYHAAQGEEHLREWQMKAEQPEQYKVYKTAKRAGLRSNNGIPKWQIETAKTMSFAKWLANIDERAISADV